MKKIKIHQHQVSTFLTCREKFNLSENFGMTARFKKKELNLGSAFHAGVREFKKGNKDFLIEGWKYFNDLKPVTQEELHQVEWGKTVVTGMLMGYADKYKDQFVTYPPIDVEKEISQSISPRVKLIGTPDSIELQKTYWVGEEKTTSKLDQDYVEKLPLDFQMSFYFVLSNKYYRRKFDGIIYRITRVTALRQKKGQTWEKYLKEIANDYLERTEWYFIQEKLYRSTDDIEKFKNELIDQVEDLMQCYKTGRWYRHTRQCTQWGCEFMRYCRDPKQDTIDTYYVQREDLDKSFSVMNKIRVDRPQLHVKEHAKVDVGTTTLAANPTDDLPF